MTLSLALKTVVAAAFAVIVVGAFLPWYELDFYTENGIDRSNGLATLVLGIAAILQTVLGRRPRAVLISISAALLCVLLAGIDFVDVSNSSGDVGIGLYLTLGASLVATGATGLLTLTILKKPEPATH